MCVAPPPLCGEVNQWGKELQGGLDDAQPNLLFLQTDLPPKHRDVESEVKGSVLKTLETTVCILKEGSELSAMGFVLLLLRGSLSLGGEETTPTRP